MIYSTNRISSLGIEANPKYYGAGAFNFMQECAKDELNIFENAITTDMNEVVLGEASYEMEAINEGFFANVWKKIKEIFKKFIEWIKAVTKSAVAKLASLLIRDNKEFAKFAKKRLNDPKMKKYEWTGTVLKSFDDPTKNADGLVELKNKIEKAVKGKDLSDIDQQDVDKWQGVLSEWESTSLSKVVEDMTTVEKIGLDEVKKHLSYMEKLGKDSIKKVKKDLQDHEKVAKSAITAAENMEKSANADNFDEKANKYNKQNAQWFVTLCNTYKQLAQKQVSKEISLIKALAKVARTVVAKAAGTTVKEGYDPILVDAMNEAVLFEYDEALEETSASTSTPEDPEVEEVEIDDDEE